MEWVWDVHSYIHHTWYKHTKKRSYIIVQFTRSHWHNRVRAGVLVIRIAQAFISIPCFDSIIPCCCVCSSVLVSIQYLEAMTFTIHILSVFLRTMTSALLAFATCFTYAAGIQYFDGVGWGKVHTLSISNIVVQRVIVAYATVGKCIATHRNNVWVESPSTSPSPQGCKVWMPSPFIHIDQSLSTIRRYRRITYDKKWIIYCWIPYISRLLHIYATPTHNSRVVVPPYRTSFAPNARYLLICTHLCQHHQVVSWPIVCVSFVHVQNVSSSQKYWAWELYGIWQTWPKLKDVRLLWMWMQSQSALLNSAHSAEYRHAVMAQWFIAIQPTHNASLHTEIIKSAASRFDLNRHFLSNWLYSLFISITISFVRLLCCFQSAPFSDLGHTAVVRICFAAFQCEAINVNCHLKWVRPRPLQSLWMFGQFRWLRMSERPRDDKYTFLTGEIFLAVTNGNQIKTSIRHFCRSFVGGTLGLSRCLWVARSDYSSTIFIELA